MDIFWFHTTALLAIGTLGAVNNGPAASRNGYPPLVFPSPGFRRAADRTGHRSLATQSRTGGSGPRRTCGS